MGHGPTSDAHPSPGQGSLAPAPGSGLVVHAALGRPDLTTAVPFYAEDLAFIHDAGFTEFARMATAAVVGFLADAGIARGLVVDLGCGSGVTARGLTDAGYEVLGVDRSAAMLDIARRQAPAARFALGSARAPELPRCHAVTAIGEVLNYVDDPRADDGGLAECFARVHGALVPGGLFVLDVAGPGRVPGGGSLLSHRTGDEWAILVETVEHDEPPSLTRRMTTFRRVGDLYRRGAETHHQRLYGATDVASLLHSARFQVHRRAGYGSARFAPGHEVFIARSPGDG